MTIKIGENPEHCLTLNKFIDHESHEGHRGVILALDKNRTRAIIKSRTDGFEGIVKRDKMYLVQEIDEGQYPQTVKEVNKIPKGNNWIKIMEVTN